MPQRKKQADKVDKRYRAKVVIPGLDKPVWVSAKTKRELEDEKRRIKEEYVNGPRREDMPFVDLIREWWDVVKKPGIRSSGTLHEWETVMRRYVYPAFPPKKLSRSVTRKDLQACLSSVEGKSTNYIVIVKSCLQNVCRYGVAEDILLKDPSVLLARPKTKPTESKRSFTQVEEEKILAAAEEIGGVEQALVYVLYYLGVRIGEAQGLRWEDVLWKQNLIHVQRDVDSQTSPESIGALKTKAANRYIPIPGCFMDWLRAHRGLPGNFIIGDSPTFLTSITCRTLLNRVMYRCGYYRLTASGKKHPKNLNHRHDITALFSAHYFRHHYVTSCIQADFRPEYTMSIVGHASYGTTIGVYTHVQCQMLEDNYRTTLLSSVLSSEIKVAKRLPKQNNGNY